MQTFGIKKDNLKCTVGVNWVLWKFQARKCSMRNDDSVQDWQENDEESSVLKRSPQLIFSLYN